MKIYVSKFKCHVSVLFIQILFIYLSKNSLLLLDLWPITVPHGVKYPNILNPTVVYNKACKYDQEPMERALWEM
jgi:hypothetical protein